MRLVACSNCHTQFDVTNVVAESFPCRCGASVENRSLEAVDAKIHRCGSCGAIVDAEVERCDYCGSTIERDPGKLSLICPECYARCSEDARFCTACGVAFRPEEVRVEGHELPCPVCDVLMPPHQIGGIGLNECRSCNGLWVAGEELRPPGEPRHRGAQERQPRGAPHAQAARLRREPGGAEGAVPEVPRVPGLHAAPQLPQELGRDRRQMPRARHLARRGRAGADRGLHPERGPAVSTLSKPPASQQERRASAEFARIQARHTMGQKRDPLEGSVVGSLLDTLVRLLT